MLLPRVLPLLLLPLFLAGCTVVVSAPPPAPNESSAAPSPPPASADCAGSTGVIPGVAADGAVALVLETSPAVELPVPADIVAMEEDEVEPADDETMADNLLLTTPDLAAPDLEEELVLPPAATFDFPVVENPKVQYFVDYYSGPGREVFARWLERSTRYLPMMNAVFAEAGLPLDLTYLAMVESGFNPKAFSWAHASGPWQFMPRTGQLYGLQDDWWHDERRDFEKSTRAAAHHLKDLHCLFEGDWNLAVASYNAGAGKMLRATKKYDTRDFWEMSQGKYLRDETKNYLPKLMAMLLIAKQPAKYGFSNLQYQSPVASDTVIIPTATDLDIVARLSGSDYATIKELNPELKRWCTPPGLKDYPLRIPAGTREQFLAAYAELPVTARANYEHHKIKKGDTLQGLAKRYHIRVADIVALNSIRNPKALRIGSNLVLPLQPGASKIPREAFQDDYVRTRQPTHTVRKGDTLSQIAQRYDVSSQELRVWNRLGWDNVIRPGQVLVVSAGAAKSKGKTKAVTASKSGGKGKTATVSAKSSGSKKPGAKGAKTTRIVYQVKAGDTLSKIARRYDVSTSRILDWNNLSASQLLQPGQRLTLLVDDADRG